MINIENGTPYSATASGTTSATTTITASGQTIYVTDISVSSDLASALMQIKDGSTVIWQDDIGNLIPYHHSFKTPLRTTPGNNLVVTITGTSACYVNVAGIKIG